MNIEEKTLSINSISFESGEHEVTLQGNIEQGTLSYSSELILSFSQLNLVLNRLVQLNDNFSIDDYMLTQYMGDDQLHYEADLSGLTVNKINLTDFYWQNELKQIRA